MFGPVQPRQRRRWIVAITAVIALGSLVIGILVSTDRTPESAAGSVPTVHSGPSTDVSGPGTDPATGGGAGGGQQGAVLPAGLKLSAGKAPRPAVPVKVATGTPLDADQVGAIVHRLPAWTGQDQLAAPFRWPTRTTPAPRGGTTVKLPFPGKNTEAPDVPESTPTAPLTVLRMQPQGAVSIAPFLSITFNQPMVPIATVGQLAATKVPVTISPKVSGSWQWIGTDTLRFATDSQEVDRLPMATEFTVTVPAGTASASGAKLAAAATFTFSTPPPSVKQFVPTGKSIKLDPVFVAVFDQRMDPETVLKSLTLQAGDGTRPIRLATPAEVAADPAAARVFDAAPAGRAVAFRSTADLPADQSITVTLAKGTRSAEGPRTTTKPFTFTGRTYAALSLVRTQCAWGNACEPGTPITLEFNNALDIKAFDPKTISVTPEIPGGATVSANGTTIGIEGATQPDTDYTVTVPAGLLDGFGQKLVAPAKGTVKFGQAARRLDPFPQPVTTLDPMVDGRSLTVNTMNRKEFRERVFAVSPADWAAYQGFYPKVPEQSYQNHSLTVPDWPVLVDRTVQIKGQANRLASTSLDLTAPLSAAGSTGHVVVLIEPTDAETFSDNDRWQNLPTLTWVQATTIGLDAISDTGKLRAWATDLRDGSPLAGVTVSPVDGSGPTAPDRSVTTDADGLASMDLVKAGPGALLATKDGQTALLPSQLWNNSWAKGANTDRLLWFVNDDRQTYRPGETVSVKGWVRRQSDDTAAALTIPDGPTVSYSVVDGYGTKIGQGSAALSAFGGFDLTVTIPAGANLGTAQLILSVPKISDIREKVYSHQFEIADFRTPDFQVDAHGDSATPYVVGDDLTVAADATYYAGGPLGDTQVDWQVRTAPATYSPPGWSGYTFGIWTPWWQVDNTGFEATDPYGSNGYSRDMPYDSCCGVENPDTSKVDTFSGSTDAAGSNYLQVKVGDLGKDYAGLPVTVTAQAEVTDVNRQQIAGSTDLLVHPADYYVGLSGGKTFVNQGEKLAVQAIATDIDGAATPGLTIDVRAAKLTTSWVNGTSVDSESDVQTCTVTSTSAPVDCSFTPKAAGSYRITATVTDKSGRTSRSQLTRWVAGPDTATDRSVQRQQLTLVPDKKEYRAGETAKVLVQSPIADGSGLLTVAHNGIVRTSRFAVKDGSAVVEVPISAADLPGVQLSIEVVGAVPRSAAKGALLRPAYATGGIGLTVSTLDRTLKVTATPRQRTVAPGGATKLDVTVTDQQGKPVRGSEFEVVVADEAVLALGGYQLPDPLQAFYPELNNGLNAVFGRSTVMLADPPEEPDHPVQQSGAAGGEKSMAVASAGDSTAAAPARASGAAQSAEMSTADAAVKRAPSTSKIAERKNFEPLALFVPSASTDANGKATIDVTLPDNLTRYRVMLVAVAGNDSFGATDSTITAGLPLTVRSSGPQFLNFGDTLDLPVLVQNLTDAPLTTDVVLQTANLKLTGPAGQRVSVPANGRIEVRFPVAADQAGTAKFRVAAVSGDDADAATIELPVYTPSTTETFAGYGKVAGGQVVHQPVTPPSGVFPQFGGLQIGTSSTALQQLSDAVGYLADYDYDSSDALAAQIIAIGSLRDVLQAFSAPGLPSPEKLKALVADDVDRLTALQNDDGGFPYWRHGDKSDPFNSIQATQALLIAKKYGASVQQDTLNRAVDFLTNIDRYIPKEATQQTRDTLHAYSLNVRMLAGQRDPAAAQKIVTARGDKLALDAVAWLLPVVTDAGARAALLQRIGNAAADDAGSVTFTNAVTDDAWTTLQSDTRTDGLILDALISVQPDSDLVGKVVAGLMSVQRDGRWDNVQENAFILLALRHYYDAFEKTTPDFVAGIWLGDKFAGEHRYSGHTTEQATVDIPTATVIDAGSGGVTLRNQGTGTLYYRLALQTAPKNLKLAPLDRGFVVARNYQAVDDPGDVSRDADGTWHIKAGARVRIKLELVSRSARSHVALIDPLPAGLQILNPELATTAKDLDPKAGVPQPLPVDGMPSVGDPAMPMTWTPPSWFDHQNLRTDRAEAFAGWLQGGVYSYSYLATATTPGTFVAPPTRAEQIYAPETFGRAGTDRVVIGG